MLNGAFFVHYTPIRHLTNIQAKYFKEQAIPQVWKPPNIIHLPAMQNGCFRNYVFESGKIRGFLESGCDTHSRIGAGPLCWWPCRWGWWRGTGRSHCPGHALGCLSPGYLPSGCSAGPSPSADLCRSSSTCRGRSRHFCTIVYNTIRNSYDSVYACKWAHPQPWN